MNIYDACNVKQLLAGYMLSALGKDCPERTAELLALEAAIREHVIREASVGTLVHACDFPDMSVTYMKDDGDLSIGDYWLIPKDAVAWNDWRT